MNMTRAQALDLSHKYSLPLPNSVGMRPDYYELPDMVRGRVALAADAVRFTKPANSNAPRDVYFYGKIGRALAKPQ